VLTLHYRNDAAFDTATNEGVKKRSYKFNGCKDEFVATLQTAMERFI
jgi:hypothetical protein